MSEQRLIDSVKYKECILSGYMAAITEDDDRSAAAYEDAMGCLDTAPTIDPETLPIIQELRAKLARYEKAEQEGRLIESPVAIGQKIYHVISYKYHVPSHINEETVVGLHLRDDENGRCTKHGEYMVTRNNGYSSRIRMKEIGETVFFTRQEAEATLEERKN